MHTIWVCCPSKSRAVLLEWVQSVWKTSLMHQEEDRTTKTLRWRLELNTSYRPINQPFPSLFHWMARWSLPTSHWFFVWTGWEKVCFTKKTLTCSKAQTILSKGKMEIVWSSWNSGSEFPFVHPKNRPMSFDEMSSLGTLQISWLPNRKAYWSLVISSLDFF